MTSSRTDLDRYLPAWARVSERRRSHIERVAAQLEDWADAMDIPDQERQRWRKAAYLHDALKDAPAEELRRLVPGVPFRPLLHGPAAAERAALDGERDQGVLDAVRYHSIGYAGWDDVGRMLYLADYLEPGRAPHDEARVTRAARVPAEPEAVLREVARERVIRNITTGKLLLPETVAFWNSLV